MATSLTPEFDINAEPEDSHEQTLADVAAKYELEDAEAYRAAHPEAAKEDPKDDPETPTDPTTVDDDDEDPDKDTPADDPDGDTAESETDSPKGDDEEDPEGDEPEDSPTAPKDDDDEEEVPAEPEDDDEVSAEFAEFAKLANIPITIDDVPEGPARQLAAQKLRSMDQQYTRVMQQATTFRKEEVAFRAEEKFRAEHPELAIIEMLEKNPELLDRVNEQYGQLTNDLTKKAFGTVVKDARREATDAVTQEIERGEARIQRAHHVESLGQRLATKANLPWEFAEAAIERALLRKPEGTRDLSDDEIVGLVTAEATNYNRHVRAHRREASKKVIQERTANRKTAPGSKTPAAAASPKPARSAKTKPMNYDSEDERRGQGMALARRLFPGARDDDDNEDS